MRFGASIAVANQWHNRALNSIFEPVRVKVIGDSIAAVGSEPSGDSGYRRDRKGDSLAASVLFTYAPNAFCFERSVDATDAS